jgi:hypothetical protein
MAETSTPYNHIPLGRLWELPDAERRRVLFVKLYESSRVPTYGLRDVERGGRIVKERVLIQSPLDYPIDWTGGNGIKPRRPEHPVTARRRKPKSPLYTYLLDDDEPLLSDDDFFDDLTISEEAWDWLRAADVDAVESGCPEVGNDNTHHPEIITKSEPAEEPATSPLPMLIAEPELAEVPMVVPTVAAVSISAPATEAPEEAPSDGASQSRRLLYRPDLSDYLGRKGPKWLERVSDLDAADNYISDHANRAKAGKTVPQLPHPSNRRHRIANQVAQIRGRMIAQAAATQTIASGNAAS